MLQTGQRIGSSAGIAVTGSVFYTAGRLARRLRARLPHGLMVLVALVFAALVLAVADGLTDRGAAHG